MLMLRRILIIASGGAVGAAMLALVSVRTGTIFGVGAQLDAYFVAVSLPSLLLSLSSSIVVAVLIPRLSALETPVARKRAGEWALLAFLLATLLAGLIALGSHFIVTALAPGLSADSAHLASRVLQVMALTLPSTMAAFVYFAYGYAFDRVWAGGGSTALYGAVWLGLLFLHPFTTSVQGIAVACLIATQIQLLAAFLLCAAPTKLPWPRLRIPRRLLPALLTVMGVLIVTVTSKINLLMDPLFGSFLPRGGVSELSYATRIAILFVSFTGQGSALTILASASHRGDRASDYRSLGLSVTLLLAVGACAAVAITFGPVAPLLLAHGALSSSSAETIGHLVQAYSVLIVAGSLAWSIESTMYAVKRVWTVTLVSLPALAANIGLSVLFVWLFGAYGRPMAVTLATILYVCLLVRVAAIHHQTSFRAYVSALPWRDAAKLVVLVSAVSGGFLVVGNVAHLNPSFPALGGLLAAGVATLAYVRTWTSRAEAQLARVPATVPTFTDAPPALAS
jgi:putative peptidoglycan lipid II flippase